MPSFSLGTLRAEILADPAGLGYAQLVSNGNMRGLADAANLPRGGAEHLVNRGTISRDEFTGDFFAAFEAVRQLAPGAVRDKWEWRLQKLLALKETINLASPNLAAMLAELQSDGLIAAPQIQSLIMRPGSWAEVVFGTGVIVTSEQCAEAVYRT